MSVRHKSRLLLLCFAVGFGSLIGIQMKPEEIEELMSNMNQPKIAHTLPEDYEDGEERLRKMGLRLGD